MYGIKVDKPAKKFKKLNFKNLKVGDKFIWVVDDFDGYSEDKCVVTEICDGHIMAYDEAIEHSIWVDENSDIRELKEG